MLIKTLCVGGYGTNCYIVTDETTLDCAVIDPGDESNTIMDYIESNKLKCKYIFLTHGHFDHTGAVEEVMRQTGATVCVSEPDSRGGRMGYRAPKGSVIYKEGDKLNVGALEFTVLETPGHTVGGVTLLCENALFTGDTLFQDSCGRTDFPGGDMNVLMRSLKRLAELPGDYEVYPGHMGASTLDRERAYNYYLKYALSR